MKKLIAMCTAFIVMSTTLIGCTSDNTASSNVSSANTSSSSATEAVTTASDGLNIVCTIFPVYDWVKEIVGDSADINVKFLCDSGIDLHNYQPTVQDIVAIKESDLFVYIGGDSDNWAIDVLDDSVNSLHLIDVLGDVAVFEEIVEGMQEHSHDDHDHEEHDDHDHEEHEDHDHEEHEDHDHEEHDDHDHEEHDDHDHEEHDDHDDHEGAHTHDGIYDEHVWLSLKNASILVDAICDELTKLLPDSKDDLALNTTEYIEKLNEIDAKYQEMTAAANRDTIVVADRFALRYIVEDYDLEYFAAFSGCSADVEVSFETMKFLTDKVGELDLDYILIIEGSNDEIANTIAETHEVEDILSFNSMQSITQNEVNEGMNYLDIMETNLEVLTKALS